MDIKSHGLDHMSLLKEQLEIQNVTLTNVISNCFAIAETAGGFATFKVRTIRWKIRFDHRCKMIIVS